MGSACCVCKPMRTNQTNEENEIGGAKWLGHTLYGNGMDSSSSSLEENMSPTRQRISEEVCAQYTDSNPTVMTILHFNDVYNIEPRDKEPVGGAARFATLVKSFQDEDPLVFFSGDALNPSIMSSVTRGSQMLPVLNAIGINTAVFGNHDFDFGVDELEDFTHETNFPWMLSNVIDNFTDQPLADGLVTRIIQYQDKKIGLIGLVEEEWLVTLTTIDRDNLTYIDFVEQGRKLSQQLRRQGADFVIALTHMRMPNDIRLAENVDEIDLILGGHDHDYETEQVKNCLIIKSGTDFRTLSKLTIQFGCHGNWKEVDKIEVTRDIEEDQELQDIVEQYKDIVSKEMEGSLGFVEVDLEARFHLIRTQETNLGNFVTDIMLLTTKAEVALLNSGTFRTDDIIPAGEFKKRDLMTLLPFIDSLVVLQVTGRQLLDALDNGVSKHPKREGRFLQVSGIKFGFHPKAEPGCRVDPYTVLIDSEHVLPNRTYRICTKEYIADGKDGYDVFKKCPVLVDSEEGPILSTIVQNHFTSVEMVKGLKPCKSGHRQSLISLARRQSFTDRSDLVLAEQAMSSISPSVEGRIYHLNDLAVVQTHREAFTTASDEELLRGMLTEVDHEGKEEHIGTYTYHNLSMTTIKEDSASPDIPTHTSENNSASVPSLAVEEINSTTKSILPMDGTVPDESKSSVPAVSVVETLPVEDTVASNSNSSVPVASCEETNKAKSANSSTWESDNTVPSNSSLPVATCEESDKAKSANSSTWESDNNIPSNSSVPVVSCEESDKAKSANSSTWESDNNIPSNSSVPVVSCEESDKAKSTNSSTWKSDNNIPCIHLQSQSDESNGTDNGGQSSAALSISAINVASKQNSAEEANLRKNSYYDAEFGQSYPPLC